MKIYTKRGDTGDTDLFGGGADGMRRVPKDSLRIEAIGTVDELNSCVGVVLSAGPSDGVRGELIEIQKDLFVLGADLATPGVVAVRGRDDVPRVSEARISEFEKKMDEMSEALEPMTAFILPGGCEAAAHLHVCRSVCRRAERVCVTLMKEEAGARRGSARVDLVVKFLNRLSDLFFVMARYENAAKKVGETKWMW